MSKDGKIYSIRWSVLTWAMTSFIFALLVGFIGLYVFTGSMGFVCPAILLAMIVLGCFLFAPLSYTLTTSAITVNRPIGGLCIPLNEIRGIRRIDKQEFGTVIRTFGVGGLFGSFGRFDSSAIGLFRGYLANTKDMILLTNFQGQKTILSPSDPDGFIQTVLEAKSAE